MDWPGFRSKLCNALPAPVCGGISNQSPGLCEKPVRLTMKNFIVATLIFLLSTFQTAFAQPNWMAIKNNATFEVADTTYAAPYIQPLNVGGWEDGLYITRDGRHLFSTYLPMDVFSWLGDFALNPICFNFQPYFRPPLLDIDTVTNVFGCPNYIHSDIIRATRQNPGIPFSTWQPSNLAKPFSFDGGAHGVLKNADTFDVFVFTRDGVGTQSTDLMFMKNVPVNPSQSTGVPILSTPAQEDNPHIERLNDSTLVLLFDRARYMYYSLSTNNGTTWQTPVQITQVLNDQAPYDVQPHLWNDGQDWWVYFCADSPGGKRGIYKSKQYTANDWNSWGPKELVIESGEIIGGSGTIFGIGEPTLTQWGDLSFVVVYGNTNSPDSTDVFDCDPWLLPKKGSPLAKAQHLARNFQLSVFPNPTTQILNVTFPQGMAQQEIWIYNPLGEKVRTVPFDQSRSFPISDLRPGVYFVKAAFQNRTTIFVRE